MKLCIIVHRLGKSPGSKVTQSALEGSKEHVLQEAMDLSLEVPHISASSKYVQQLFQDKEPATPDSTVQQELQQLKAQITDAAAKLELERQAYQRARVRSLAQQL